MTRCEAIKEILCRLSKNHLAVFTTGMISREAFNIKDRNENFYMIGSMGLAASYGLGIALNTKKKVIVFDGDGSALMEMGNMALIGYNYPKNLIHIILDNESYQSTGGQPTITKKTELAHIAKASGYGKVFKITKLPGLKKKIGIFLNQRGPIFVLIKTDKKSADDISRVTYGPEYIKERFKHAA